MRRSCRAWIGLVVWAVATLCIAAVSPARALILSPHETEFQPAAAAMAYYWEQHRWPFAGAVLLVLLQAALVVGLLVNRARRRQAEAVTALIAEISSKFVNLPASEVDREIGDAQGRLCGLLKLDLSALWQWSDRSPGSFMATHLYSLRDGPLPPEQMIQDDFPWVRQEILAGRMVAARSLDEMPAAAAKDREAGRRLGIKSHLTLPLAVGGGSPIGILGFNATQAERDWPDALVGHLQQIAQIFANALSRKRADEELRASKARLVAGTELAGLGYFEIDYGKRSCFLDDRFRAICGIPDEVLHDLMPVEYWLQQVHPDDRQPMQEERQKLHHGSIDRLSAVYRYQHPVHGEKWLHHLACSASRSTDGAKIRTFGVVRDITEQRLAEAEVQTLRGDLAHVGRVTLLGQLASALAHELSQPLGAILRNAEAAEILLQAPVPDLEELRAIVTDILADDQRAGQVIDRLRSLLKRRSLDPQPVDLQGVITAVMSLVKADAASRQVKLLSSVPADLPLVLGDRIHLQQVLLNLLVNAMDALVESDHTEHVVRVHARLTDAAMVEVRVSDNGPGFGRETSGRLFEPFFTTKATGMGMGLPVSQTLIEAHNGKLWAEANPAGGACFCFTLQVAATTRPGVNTA